MQSIEWDNSFSIGVQEIDDQHREWLEYFNAVANAINEGHGEEKVSNTLAFLVGYTEEHLLTEEHVGCGLPGNGRSQKASPGAS